MIRKLLIVSSLFAALLISGCEKFDPQPEYAMPRSQTKRTLLVYLAMNNSLSIYANQNVQSILKGVTRQTLGSNRLFIYKADRTGQPVLMEVRLNGGGRSYLDTLLKYPAQYSVAPSVMRGVLDKVKELSPSDTYAMDIGSHGSNWMVDGLPIPSAAYSTHGTTLLKSHTRPLWLTPLKEVEGLAPSRSIADDNDRYRLQLADFAGMLADGELEYLMMDACYAGSAEVAYALRKKASWLVLSPAEIPGQGMPYDQIIGDLMADAPRLGQVCKKYYDYYNAKGYPYYGDYYATVALYDCSAMDALAAAFRPVAQACAAKIEAMDTGLLQRYDTYQIHTMFDIYDLVQKLIPNQQDANYALRQAFEQALEAAVPYKAATAVVRGFPMDVFHGMSVFVPASSMPSELKADYRQTAWYSAVY